MSTLVIIGTGLAGYNLAKEVRKRDPKMNLCLISQDDGAFYSKPMLSNALAKNKKPDSIVSATAEQMAIQLNAEIKTHTEVLAIDTVANQVETTNGIIRYDNLVLAMGASQVDAGFTKFNDEFVFSINNLQDYRRFHLALNAASKVVIVGTGLIGCEFANDMVSIGKDVTVVGPSHIPLARLVPQQVGDYVRDKLAEVGVHWQLGTRAVAIEHSNKQGVIALDNGVSLNADLVLTAIGLAPRLGLAIRAGLRTNRGIVVDTALQSSQENIYAIGDCAEINAKIYAFVLPIMHCSRVLAATLTGERTEVHFPVMPVIVKTPAHSIVSVPPEEADKGGWQVSMLTGGMSALYNDDYGILKGFVLTGSAVEQRQSLVKALSQNTGV